MEGYILGGLNIAFRVFKKKFSRLYGRKELDNFLFSFRENFIQEKDIERIKKWKANCLRLPFNCRILKEKGGRRYIDTLLGWAGKYNLKVILDMHAGCAPQNQDWHSDSLGKALLWKDKRKQEETIRLWEKIASWYKGNETVAGYDLLNEPVLNKRELPQLVRYYRKLIKTIRGIDSRHKIFLEGNLWAQEIDFLKNLISDSGIWVSIHTYQPLDFVFNFVPHLRYPSKEVGSKKNLKRYLEKYASFSRRYKVNILVGEIGVNFRDNFYGEIRWLEDMLRLFREFGFSWTYWTYKAVAGSVFPDGVFQYRQNPAWVKREGPEYGWENFYRLWPKEKRKIAASWRTENFDLNQPLLQTIKKFLVN